MHLQPAAARKTGDTWHAVILSAGLMKFWPTDSPFWFISYYFVSLLNYFLLMKQDCYNT